MRPNPFVGRGKETAWIRAELEAGRSVVLIGICGIGRTALARHVAEEMAREWLFVFADFARAPGQLWRDLFAAAFPKAQERCGHKGGPPNGCVTASRADGSRTRAATSWCSTTWLG